MTEAQQAALAKWGEICSEYVAIEIFLDWRARHPHHHILPARDLLDEYFGINRQDFEAARRALLQEARAKLSEIGDVS